MAHVMNRITFVYASFYANKDPSVATPQKRKVKAGKILAAYAGLRIFANGQI